MGQEPTAEDAEARACRAPRSCLGGLRGAAAPLRLVSALSLSGSRAPRPVCLSLPLPLSDMFDIRLFYWKTN